MMDDYLPWIWLGLGLVVVYHRGQSVLRTATEKDALRQQTMDSATVWVDRADVTEKYETKALRLAKTGGGFLHRPINVGGTVREQTCYVEAETGKKKHGKVALRCVPLAK